MAAERDVLIMAGAKQMREARFKGDETLSVCWQAITSILSCSLNMLYRPSQKLEGLSIIAALKLGERRQRPLRSTAEFINMSAKWQQKHSLRLSPEFIEKK
jgi:hypothetical protein